MQRAGPPAADGYSYTDEPLCDFSYDGVLRSFEASLERLGLDRVDIVHIHDCDDHFEEALAGAYRALDRLRSEGTIAAVGAGMNQAEMLPSLRAKGGSTASYSPAATRCSTSPASRSFSRSASSRGSQ